MVGYLKRASQQILFKTIMKFMIAIENVQHLKFYSEYSLKYYPGQNKKSNNGQTTENHYTGLLKRSKIHLY